MDIPQESKQNRTILIRKKTVFILIGLYFLMRLTWLFMVPMVGAPDEFSHAWVINFMAQNLRLPDGADMTAGGASAVYASLPQIGYLPHVLCALVAAHLPGLGALDISLTGRFGSLFVGLGLLLASIYISNQLFADKSKLVRLAVPLLIIFHPQLILVNAYANNDSTAISMASLALAAVTAMIMRGPSYRLSLITGLLCGILALTKYSGYAVFPACALGMLISFRLHKTGLKESILHVLCAALTTVLLSAWWFTRNLSLYPGDALGTKTMFKSWATTYNRDLNFYMTPWQVVKQHRWWRSILFSFWGLFGYMDKYMWRWVYWTYFGFMTLGLVGSCARAADGIKALRGSHFNTDSHLITDSEPVAGAKKQAAIWAVLTVTLLANILAMIYASTVNLGGGQGRYLFPSEIPIMCLIVQGINWTPSSWRKPLLLLLLVFNVLVSLGAFIYLYPQYGFHFSKTY